MMRKILSFTAIILLFSGYSFAQEVFEYDAKDKRDPFVPLVSESGAYVSDAYGVSSIKDIRLEGIVWDEDKGSIAIINGEIVGEGQKVGIAEVIKIEKDAVLFEIDNQEIRIELSNE